MSILIKGMEMPTNCLTCACADNAGCAITGAVLTTKAMAYGRADNCPLVPVPNHGKMIIRDGEVIERDGSTDVRDYGKEIT